MGRIRTGLRVFGAALASAGLVSCSASRHDAFAAGDSTALATYYEKEAGVVRVPVANPRFVDSGPAIRAEMLDLVRGAKDHILLDSFLVNDGPETREILDALAAKAAEGVQVRVISDASSRYVMEPEAFEYLESEGVATAEFNPFRGWRLLLSPVLFERDHRKFWIVDGRHVFLGGANLSDSSLELPEKGGNRDLMVRVDSPEAAKQLTRSFIETWNKCDTPMKIEEAHFEGTVETAQKGVAGYWFFNQENVRTHPSLMGTMMEGLFASAHSSIWLVEPYTFTNPGVLKGIRSMTDRGVEVNLVLSSQTRAPRFRYASYYGIRDLLAAGARVWVFDSKISPLHYKCALVDDRLAYVGSANLNFRSYHLSRELNAVFDDPASVLEVRKVIDSVRANCREVDAEEAGRYRSIPFATWWLIMQSAG